METPLDKNWTLAIVPSRSEAEAVIVVPEPARITEPLPGVERATTGLWLPVTLIVIAEELVTLPELSVACAVTL